MNWSQFIARLKKMGYEGSKNDFVAVQAFLEDEELDTDYVESNGKSIRIAELYEKRSGKPLDVSDVERQAEIESLADQRVTAAIEKLESSLGVKARAGAVNPPMHDVRVGKDLVEDDDWLGYGEYGDLAEAFWLRDVGLSTIALSKGQHNRNFDRLHVCEKIMQSRFKAPTGLNEGLDSEGGFTVPTPMASEILRKMHESGRVFNRARRLVMTSKSAEVSYINETSRATGSRHGGVRGYWTAEGAELTSSKPAFGKLTLNAKKLSALGYVTDELEEDSVISQLSLMNELFAEELSFLMDDAFINGDGVGKPLGILNANATLALTRDGGDSDIGGIDVLNMWVRLWARSQTNAVWFVSQAAMAHIHRLGVVPIDGGAGDMIRMTGPPGSEVNTATIFNRPVIVIEQCANLGTVGDIILADMKQYLYGDRRGVTTASSMHVKFTQDEMAFKATVRLDGQPWWNSALTPFNGGDTISPFITLAT